MQMYIKILVYIIDNQQVKYKISIIFFGSQIVCRSYFPSFVDWGGLVKKTAALPSRFRGGGPSRITNPLIIQLFYYICDMIKT